MTAPSSLQTAVYNFIRELEGGYSNNPADHGGATNFGITQSNYDAYRKEAGLSTQPVKAISQDEVSKIFQKNYWNVVQGDKLPPAFAYAVTDYGFHSGPARAVKALQELLSVTADGIMGPNTHKALQRHPNSKGLLESYIQQRSNFLHAVIAKDPSQEQYLFALSPHLYFSLKYFVGLGEGGTIESLPCVRRLLVCSKA